jgi:outer membrane receptor protein involved in Fe transport
MPGNDLKRDNLNLRVTARMSKRLSLDAKITSFHQNVNNRVPTGDDLLNPVRSVLLQPGNITLEDVKDYEFVDTNGLLSQNYWIPDNLYNNQYWIINRDPSKDLRNRTLSVVSAKYEFFDGLSLQVRTSSDFIYDKSSQNLYNDTFTVAPRGNYLAGQSNTSELNNDLLLNYNKNVTSSFSLNISAGGNMLTQKNYSMSTSNTELLTPNLFTATNALKLTATEYGSTKKVNSLYGFATLGLKNWLFLDLTIRNDWSSTLPPESWSYFYPSAGLTWIVSDMVKARPGWLTFAKLRASLAQVGNDTDPYQLDPSFSFQPGGELGYLRRGWTKPPTSLKPEITSSEELGFDIRFLDNRIGLDLTWYKSNSKNQLLSVRVPAASGYVEKFVNAGNIQNSGIEATLNLKPLEGGFKWDIAINFAKNNSLVVELAEGLKEFTLTGGQLTLIKVVEGNEYGDIFTRGFVRNEAGRKLIDKYGMPITTSGQDLLMGNYNPDWIGGIRNSFAWKGFDFSFLVDIRMGGDVFSTTQSYLAADGYADYTLEGRNGMVVDGIIQTLDEDGNVISERENDVKITAEAYWQHLGGRDAQVGEVYKYDGSNIRVSEMVFGYTKNFKSSVIRNINISLVGRNLFFIMNKSKIMDPNLMVGNNNAQGNESYGLPGTRTVGMNLRATF